MSFYGNLNPKYYTINETSFKDLVELMKKWKTSNENHAIQTFKSSSLSKEEYEDMKNTIDQLYSVEKYADYKKAFEHFCKFINISPIGVIITKHELKEGKKEDDSSLEVQYCSNTKKIDLPEDVNLYHMSKIDNITSLEPQFRGKSEKGYLYYSPRIYFTIYKNMPKVAADYGAKTKMNYYEAETSIKQVYVDPLLWNKTLGAVYIETNQKVPVKKVNGGTTGMIKDALGIKPM